MTAKAGQLADVARAVYASVMAKPIASAAWPADPRVAERFHREFPTNGRPGAVTCIGFLRSCFNVEKEASQ